MAGVNTQSPFFLFSPFSPSFIMSRPRHCISSSSTGQKSNVRT